MRRWWYLALCAVGFVAIRVSTTPIELVEFTRAPRGERQWFTLADNQVHVMPIVVVVAAVVALIATFAPPRTTIPRARVGRVERLAARAGRFAAGVLRHVEDAREVAIGAGFLGMVAVGLLTMYFGDETAIGPAAAYVLLGALLFAGRRRPHSAS